MPENYQYLDPDYTYTGTIDGDVEKLRVLILELVSKKSGDDA